MITKRLFRTLILTALFLSMAGAMVTSLTASLLPPEIQAYLDAASQDVPTSQVVLLVILFVVTIPLMCAAVVGLCLFWPPARGLYLWITIVSVALTPLFGPYCDYGWGQTFLAAADILEGVILALVYWSPVKDYFENPQPPPLPTQ
jgi:magnesium-transporting ATPase (P-type)